ncbi:MAG: 4-hydroxybenzoate octaprenyltransferase [Tatlockia sp.]|nr:4-hydroxybenzoate octaprenyltransferase [Tatlockia sp.]
MIVLIKLNAYLRLMRFHKPAGILLLWFPTAWALWLANKGTPPLKLVLLFALGTILMRAAGCVINDMADRHVDLHVKRTQTRPLVNGDLGLPEALILVILLLFFALEVLFQLPKPCFYYALAAVFITVLYPFCKRIIQGPQFVLGLAFSMGIPMAYVASNQAFNLAMLCLLLINFLWIISYDTQYAMVDKDDDLRIGVKSTAILFGSYARSFISLFQILFHLLWLVVAIYLGFSFSFYLFWITAGALLFYQQRLLGKNDRPSYLQAFNSNSYYGLIMWLGLIYFFLK